MQGKKTISLFMDTFQEIIQHPYLWILALISVLGQLRALLTYESGVILSAGLLFFALLSLVSDAAIMWAIVQHVKDRSSNILDAFMTALSYIGHLIIIKFIPSIPFIFLTMVGVVVIGKAMINQPTTSDLITTAALLIPMIILSIILQIVTFFAMCFNLLENISFGESLREAWELTKNHKKKLTTLFSPFLIADILLIGILIASSVITYESAFGYQISEKQVFEYEQRGKTFLDKFTIFTINRLYNSVVDQGAKYRTVDFIGYALFLIPNINIGLIILLVIFLQLPFRIGVGTATFLEYGFP